MSDVFDLAMTTINDTLVDEAYRKAGGFTERLRKFLEDHTDQAFGQLASMLGGDVAPPQLGLTWKPLQGGYYYWKIKRGMEGGQSFYVLTGDLREALAAQRGREILGAPQTFFGGGKAFPENFQGEIVLDRRGRPRFAAGSRGIVPYRGQMVERSIGGRFVSLGSIDIQVRMFPAAQGKDGTALAYLMGPPGSKTGKNGGASISYRGLLDLLGRGGGNGVAGRPLLKPFLEFYGDSYLKARIRQHFSGGQI